VPPGNIPPDPHLPKRDETFPSTSFDFFPFCGIQRPVLLSAVPKEGISDISVTTDISGHAGIVRIKVNRAAGDTVIVHAWLRGTDVSTEGKMVDEATIELTVPDAMLWSPDSPYLYDLIVELSGKNTTFDRYSLPIGIRTIKVDGDALLLNGRPVYLRGFGRHEDFPVTGRGLVPAVIVKDYALMKWIGANSFRTSHYPYSEQMMDLADRLGFLVIDEIPAVGLFFDEEGSEHRLSLCRQYLRELIERDKNHPGVIAWSIANEPASSAASKPFFRNLYDLAKSLDTTRPVTLVSEMEVEKREKSFEFLDIVCLNRYYGWYIESGQMDAGMARLAADIDAMHEQFKKPIIMTEFGADAMSGHHAQPPEMFSEEYQAELLTRYINLFKSRPFIVGEHVWNLCDFKTAQRVRRAGSMNLKGVFTRDRRPKMAAHRLRELWTKPQPDKTG
jgi:beta-glucuronidase